MDFRIHGAKTSLSPNPAFHELLRVPWCLTKALVSCLPATLPAAYL